MAALPPLSLLRSGASRSMRPRIYRNRRCVKWSEEALDLPRGRDRIASKENNVMGRYNRSTRREASIRRYMQMTLPRSVIGALVVGLSAALTGCIGAMQTVFGKVVNLGETEFKPGSERALRLDGTITRLAPGSRALRYLVGFGAGRSKAQAEMRFVDVQSGQVVMVTADRRVAAYGVFGGDSEDHLKESFGDMARDLAKFLTRLARGEAPQGKD